MLVYEKMNKKPLKEVVKKPSEAAAPLECTDTAPSREATAPLKEEEILLPFNSIPDFVPDWVRN